MNGEYLLNYLIIGAIGAVSVFLLARRVMRTFGGPEGKGGCSCCSENDSCTKS